MRCLFATSHHNQLLISVNSLNYKTNFLVRIWQVLFFLILLVLICKLSLPSCKHFYHRMQRHKSVDKYHQLWFSHNISTVSAVRQFDSKSWQEVIEAIALSTHMHCNIFKLQAGCPPIDQDTFILNIQFCEYATVSAQTDAKIQSNGTWNSVIESFFQDLPPSKPAQELFSHVDLFSSELVDAPPYFRES